MTHFLFKEYTQLIASLPDDDEPSFFGLPANIERSWQRIVSSQVIGQLKSRRSRFHLFLNISISIVSFLALMRSSELAQRFDRELWHQQLTPVLNLWKKLHQVNH